MVSTIPTGDATADPRMLRFSRVLPVLQAPVILPQARRLRRDTPRLPEASRSWEGSIDASGPGVADPLRLLVLGDSTAAGIGVDDLRDGLSGRLAHELRARTGRGVRWRTFGEGGATSRDLVERFASPAYAAPFDLLFLTVGANDALTLRSARSYARDLGILLRQATAASPQATVLLTCLPQFQRFELLPEPLRGALFRHSRALERAARRATGADPRWMLSGTPPPYTDDFWAADRFHPGPNGYRDWAEWAIDDAWDRGLARALGAGSRSGLAPEPAPGDGGET